MLNRSFTLFWFSRVASMAAVQMLMVAVGWQIYALTHSALDLGLVGLVSFIPQVLLVLVVGQVADRFDRRHVVRICQIIEGSVALVLAIGSLQGWLSREHIYALVLAFGAARAFESPTMAALMPSLVTPEQLPRAASLSATAMQTAIILGPAIGGFIYVAGPGVVYATVASLYIGACVLVTLIDAPKTQTTREPPDWRSVFAGFAFIRRHPVILGSISLDLFAVLLGGATALLPIFARDILHTGPWGLGLLRSAPAAGALLMSVWLSRHPIETKVGTRMFTAVAVFGLATIAFGLSTTLPTALISLFVIGASDMISVVIRSALVQLETPEDMRGRVNAVNFLFIGTSNQLGEFESGVTAAWLGPVGAVLLGGVGTLVIAGLWARWFPELLRRDQLVAKTPPV